MLQVNAQLITVTGAAAATGGTVDDWDDDVTGGVDSPTPTEKWAGTADAYYTVRRVRRQSAGGVDVVAQPTLIIDKSLADEIGIDENDVLEFVTAVGQTLQGTASAISGATLDGMPAEVQTARFELTLTEPLAA
jgi:hypothetical protein